MGFGLHKSGNPLQIYANVPGGGEVFRRRECDVFVTKRLRPYTGHRGRAPRRHLPYPAPPQTDRHRPGKAQNSAAEFSEISAEFSECAAEFCQTTKGNAKIKGKSQKNTGTV